MKRTGASKVFKLLIMTGKTTTTSKTDTDESDRVTCKEKRWSSWSRGRRGVQDCCSEDFN